MEALFFNLEKTAAKCQKFCFCRKSCASAFVVSDEREVPENKKNLIFIGPCITAIVEE